MANYYLAFSKTLGIENNDEYEWLKSQLKKLDKAEPGDENWRKDFCYQFEKNNDDKVVSIWFYTEESGEPSHVADLVQKFLKRFGRDEVWSMEWSNWCDKPRLDAYGGGAVIVTSKEQLWMNTNRWADEKTKELLEREKGIQAVIALQKMVGITEPRKRAEASWDSFSAGNKKTTLEAYAAVVEGKKGGK